MQDIEYTQHENDKDLEQVQSMCLTGLRVMVGRWDDGTAEILTNATMPYDPMDAQIAFDSETL